MCVDQCQYAGQMGISHCFVCVDQCQYVGQMEISHCLVCVDQVWVCWADVDLSLLCVCGSVSVCWADGDLSLPCVCGSGVGMLGRCRSLTAVCVWIRCGCVGQMEISHCIVCVDQVWVCWADGDLL